VRPARAADHSTPSSATIMEEYSYTSTHHLGHTGPVTGSHYLYRYYIARVRLSQVRDSYGCMYDNCPLLRYGAV